MRQTLLAGLAIALTLVGGPLPLRAAAPRPVITKVFGPETRTGPYKHPASLTELSNGDLYLVYYGGQGEYAKDTTVFGSRLAKGSRNWTPPKAIAKDPFRSVGNGPPEGSPSGRFGMIVGYDGEGRPNAYVRYPGNGHERRVFVTWAKGYRPEHSRNPA